MAGVAWVPSLTVGVLMGGVAVVLAVGRMAPGGDESHDYGGRAVGDDCCRGVVETGGVRALVVLVVAGLMLAGCEAELAPHGSTPASRPAATATPTVMVLVPPEVVCEWARVRSVTDGDTVRVDFEGGERNRPVRYIGVDTPETRHPTLGVQPFGQEASKRNAELVGGRRVCLEKDVSELDRFDRLLRYVWLEDGRMVNEVLVAEGLAVTDTFPPDVKYVERFLGAQREAAGAGRGLWAE